MKNSLDNKYYRLGNIFLFLIVLTVIYISHRYLMPFLWAGLTVISIWPAYSYVLKHWFKGKQTLAASAATVFIGVVIFTPITLIVMNAITETFLLIGQYQHGIPEPAQLSQLPYFGAQLHELWQNYLAKPDALTSLINQLNDSLKSNAGSVVSSITTAGGIIIKHTISIFFFFLFVFFLFKDGEYLADKINVIGRNLLNQKWNTYFMHLPQAIRAVVNGTVSVGLIVGILMGICYYALGLDSAPFLFGFVTTILAMIPFGITVAVLIAAFLLLIKGSYIKAIVIIVFGATLTFITDHFIKPKIIGSSTNLPFLMILIGILGGVETLGMIGLFLGPIIMLLMCTLFNQLANVSVKNP